ncbi:winged-helix domain-containing protein [Halobaculum litoreum]|uniref:Winged-helix domain-containing protein n=1 Tax=Halobaculum litoreum TaxID=3031998 RepID=A0ABD5XSA4_9EURY
MSDSVVLEFFAEHDLELPPKALSRNLNRHGYDIGYSTVRLRVRKLAENGMLEKDDDGYYELTEKGRLWLDDELSAADLEGNEE